MHLFSLLLFRRTRYVDHSGYYLVPGEDGFLKDVILFFFSTLCANIKFTLCSNDSPWMDKRGSLVKKRKKIKRFSRTYRCWFSSWFQSIFNATRLFEPHHRLFNNRIKNKVIFISSTFTAKMFYFLVRLLHPSNFNFLIFPCARATRHTPRIARKELFKYNSVPMINYHMDRVAVRIR